MDKECEGGQVLFLSHVHNHFHVSISKKRRPALTMQYDEILKVNNGTSKQFWYNKETVKVG